MTFSDFTSLGQIQEQFQINISSANHMFPHVQPIPVPEHYAATREEDIALALAMNTEKARSEFIIAPLLIEAWRSQKAHVSLFSGWELKVEPEHGLSGRCDFLFTASAQRLLIEAPILNIVEAKNDNVQSGFAQCIAAMIAAKKFNEAKKRSIPAVFGCSTTGTEWRFLKLEGDTAFIDFDDYLIVEPAKILGILVHILQTVH